jgi:hypothetical protein
MDFGQTIVVKLVHHLPPSRKRIRQAFVDLAPKWGWPAKVWPTGHLLGPLGQGLVPRGLLGQWTPMVTRALIIFPFRSLKKLQIDLQVPEIK